jgi:heat shock protein HtpX
MATLYTHQESNISKTWLLMLTMFALIMAVGWFLSYYYNSPIILIIAVVFSIGLNIFSYWFSDKIALSMSGAKPTFDSSTGAVAPQFIELNRIVENLAITAGLPKPRVYVINDAAPNAFATGRNKNHSAIAVTTGLLATLERAELEGVLAHEMAHVGNKDILISTIAVVLAGFLSIVADMFMRSSLYGFGGGNRDNDSGKAGGVLIIVGIALMILAPFAGFLIRMAISRKREYLADATGALITRYPEGLASALEKISAYQAPMNKAHDATAHLYISNPFGSKAVKGMHALFMTHPPAEERIRRLRG